MRVVYLYARITQGFEYVNSYWIYLIMSELRKSACMAFVLHFSIVITRGYLFQRLPETRSYCLKEHEAVFLKRQHLIFSLVAESI